MRFAPQRRRKTRGRRRNAPSEESVTKTPNPGTNFQVELEVSNSPDTVEEGDEAVDANSTLSPVELT